MIHLYWITFAVELLGLVLALWLGLYLVSLSPKYPLAWLTAITLWSLAGLFMNVLLAMNPPPVTYNQPAWLRFMWPFWPEGTMGSAANRWLQGWSVIAAFAVWHHATSLMRPGALTLWRKMRILGGYLLALLAIWAHNNSPILYLEANSDPLYVNSLRPGQLYPFIALAMGILVLGSMINLIRTARETPFVLTRRQYLSLVYATLFAGLGFPISIVSSVYRLPIPMVVLSLVEAISVGFFGYGIARFSAVVKGRTIQRDFLYNLALLVMVVTIYLLASFFLVRVYLAPPIVLVLVPVLAVLTHSLLVSAHRLMDWLFYRRETRQLRTNLQHLVRLAGEGVTLEENLKQVLRPLCTSVNASHGLILTFSGEELHQAAEYQWRGGLVDLQRKDLACDDVIHLAPGQFAPPLDETALLIPLYADIEQLGAILLGRPTNSLNFAPFEVELLSEHADRIGEMVSIARRKAQSLEQIAKLAQAHHLSGARKSNKITYEIVEKTLQNLSDYTFLAETCLAELELVKARLAPGQITSLERGKAVHALLLEALDKLRPGPAQPHEPLPREWYPYVILHSAYLEQTPNSQIMLRLFISDGTFNRTRRAAIRTLALTLDEMENAPLM